MKKKINLSIYIKFFFQEIDDKKLNQDYIGQ